MNEDTRNRRETLAGFLRERFESNIHMIKKMVWQDEKGLTFKVSVNPQTDRVYGKGKKSDIPDENLLSLTNKMSKKVMLSATITEYGVIKLFFVNKNGIEVNKENNC